MGRRAKPAKVKAKAKPPLARKAPTKGAARVHELEQRLAESLEREKAKDRALTEALEQQTATSEILGVISQSPTDVQPVFAAVATSAARLCDAFDAAIHRIDDDVLRMVAHEGPIQPDVVLPLAQGTLAGHVVRERRAMQVADIQAETDAYPVSSEFARNRGFRTILSVPLVRGDEAIGIITIRRTEVRPFSDRQIELLRTFADQAVIAIENVRLFNETKEALEQQTATSEILGVISSSPTDVHPVFDVILQNALRLCGAERGTAYTYNGEAYAVVAARGMSAEAEAAYRAQPRRPSPHTGLGRIVVEKRPVHIADVTDDIAYRQGDPMRVNMVALLGARTALWVPLLKEDTVVGALSLYRQEVRPFTEQQIALVKTFADQAVIALENVRLFTELQTSNRDLTTALDKQTATADILRVISRSQTDVQPVFDAIMVSAVRLLRAHTGALTRIKGDQIEIAALTSADDAGDAALRARFPQSLLSEDPHAQVIRARAPFNVADAQTDPQWPQAARAYARIRGYRSAVVVPMLRHDEVIGSIGVNRREPGGFTDDEVALLQTFADQAVIAIENVRLFTELQASNRELTTALETQTATGDILRVISRSQTDVQPVFDAILASAVRLLGAYSGALTRIAGDQIELAAFTSIDDAADATHKATYPQSLHSEWPHAQAIRNRAPLNIADYQTDPRWSEAERTLAHVRGFRSAVAVPMLRHDEPVGSLGVTRREAGGFTDDEIALLQTFADQAVIAIENARLLTELHGRTTELTRSVGELQALGEVSRALSSTLDLETVLTTIVSRAVQLSGLDGGVVFEYDERAEEFVHRASSETGGVLAEVRRAARIPKGEGVVGRTAITLEPVQVPDIAIRDAYESRLRESLLASGVRAVLAVPMVREGQLIGGLVVSRNSAGAFPPETVELLRTFATQSALAIQNARLFHELEIKSRELEVASQHKSEFLASMSHELRTPLNAIIGFSDVLLQGMFGEMSEKQTEYLQDILASGQHLLSLINDILDLSKIEAGRMDLEVAVFDLPAAIDDAMLLMRERAGRRGIMLERHVDERLGEVRADQRKIKQVLLNLLSNAVKFTPEGGRIDVRAGLANGAVEISVADTGIGIAPEDHDAVFEEFRQVGKAEKKAEGTGLGLALCRKFVELHGGRIWVKSAIGQGSTFTFTLPLSR